MKDNIEILDWKNARHLIGAANQPLMKIIDKLSPSSKYKLVKATYNFGDLIINNGRLNIRENNALISLERSSLNRKIKEELGYSKIPLSFLVNKSTEVFINDNEYAIPLNIIQKGNLFGVFETQCYMLNQEVDPIWSVSLGSRNIFMLPKINNQINLNNLYRELGLPGISAIQSHRDHWELFKLIAEHPTISSSWSGTLLFFTEPWFKHTDDEGWMAFNNYIYRLFVEQSLDTIKRTEFIQFWRKCIRAIDDRRLKPLPYISDTIKHILLTCFDLAPGIVPSWEDEEAAPISQFQEIMLDIYKLKKYCPTIMLSKFNGGAVGSPAYYSLNYPTLYEGSPSIKLKPKTVISDLRMIKLLIDTIRGSHFLNDLEREKLNKINIEYFHIEKDLNNVVLSSDQIPQTDHYFINEKEIFKGREFCVNSLFWRGCIQLTRK